MNKETRQILKNQRTILECLQLNLNKEMINYSEDRINETCNLLKDGEESKEEDCCEMPKRELKEEEKEGCDCGYEVEEGKEGCGEVIEEWTKEDDEGKIIDNGWYHCGENDMLCDYCKAIKFANQKDGVKEK